MPGTYRSPAESGLYYLKSRYYDPQICRFINADILASTGQGFIGTNMFSYCGNCPPRYCDQNGKYIEEYEITPFYSGGEHRGFSVDNDERFLDPDYCLGFADELIEKDGASGSYAGMSSMRIALELYAHAALYYYGLALPDPLENNGINSFMVQKSPGQLIGDATVSYIKQYFIDRGKVITVNNDESTIRMTAYKWLWKRKTGIKYSEA